MSKVMNMTAKRGGSKSAQRHGHKVKKGTLPRLLKMLFKTNGGLLGVVFFCLIISSVVSVASSIFVGQLVSALTRALTKGLGLEGIWPTLTTIFITMGCVYVAGIIANLIYSRLMAIVTQRFLHQIRTELFNKMQALPVRFFDRNHTGNIMSVYTNDTDALRQLVSQSIPQLFTTAISIVSLLYIMFSYSIWLSLVIFVGIFAMTCVSKFIGGNSGKYFVKSQQALGETEGFIQEMMQGQKVVKVFNHEEQSKLDFDKKNDQLCHDSTKAHSFANILMPIMGNIGNILYVLVAFVGGLLVSLSAPNLSINGLQTLPTTEYLVVIVAFLPICKQFAGNISHSSQHINSVIMGLAGAGRIFALMDEQPEPDDGYVTLVRCHIDSHGNITETQERTGHWAWKHPHKADGTITYTELKGDIQMFDVDFGYVPEKIVLHDVSLYARPGQKIAFVGATGAGKTTITNLINRFYDIADGKIRYDGININKIKKADLRRSLGIVLQDTNLFTGTVMENIRYGRLDATDQECIDAAKLAYAHDFITRLPNGYDTMLTSDGANLSQGQRQLLSIARAAVKDAPVMILDEATSSIDTRTELLVQKGTDRLMQGRTVFVIAHRLSTVKNSNVIMVLENGRIIERGSHDELIEKQGQYYQLYTGAFELE